MGCKGSRVRIPPPRPDNKTGHLQRWPFLLPFFCTASQRSPEAPSSAGAMATWGLGMMSLVGQNGNTSHWANARVSVPMMRSFSRFIFAELHMRLSVRLFLVCGAVSLFANTVACAAEQLPAGSRAGVVRVGLERNLGPDFLIESFAPTMRLLRREKPNTTFKTT